MLRGKRGQFYHVSNNHFIKIKDVIKKICKSLNISFKNNIKITRDRTGKDFFYKLSSSKIRNELNWRPKIKLDEGINKVLNWYKLNKNKIRKSDTIYVHKK